MGLNLKARVTCCVLVPLFYSHCIKGSGSEREFLARYVTLARMRREQKFMLGISAEGLEEVQDQEGRECEMVI